MARREYTAGRATTLDGAFNIGATTFTIADDGSATTWPTSTDYDFFVTIDAGTAQEERVLCSARSGRTITVAASGRGKDSTGEKNHASGATVWPSWSAQDADEANAHIESTGYASFSKSVHGLGSGDGVVVGTDKSQTLTAKTLTAPTITSPTISGTITGAVVTSTNIVNGTIVNEDIATDAAIVATKLTGTITEFNTALTDNDFATLTSAQTLTNKTLTEPIISGITYSVMPALATATTTATLTAAQLLTGHLLATISSPATYTLPTGSQLNGALLGGVAGVGTSFDFIVTNPGGAMITIAAPFSGITLIGNVFISSSSSASFRFRKTGLLGEFTMYRIG